jgi:hypothetical protein
MLAPFAGGLMTALYLFGSLLAIVVIALGVAFGILLAKRLETIWGERALGVAFGKPLRAVVVGVILFLLVGVTYIEYIKAQ